MKKPEIWDVELWKLCVFIVGYELGKEAMKAVLSAGKTPPSTKIDAVTSERSGLEQTRIHSCPNGARDR
jgi:hypothetical protein